MSTRRSNARPARSASALTSARRRTPQAGFLRRRSASKADVARRRRLAVDEIGTVQDERSARHEMARGAAHQRSAGRPFGDVQHVRAVQGVEATERLGPARRENVQHQRRPDVAERRRARSDRRQRGRVCLGRLPVPVGTRSGEVLGVLAASARDLEHRRGSGQDARQHLEDGCLVAVGGGTERHLFFLVATPCRRRRSDPVRAASIEAAPH